MPRKNSKLFPIPLNRREKDILDRVAQASGLSRCGVLRQLLLLEHQSPAHKKRLAMARSDQ